MRGGAGSELTLLDELLAEQRSLTAVERFAQKHAGVEEPVQARYYRDLIPLSAPGVGEQYAFEVDLGECSGCKACVTACHSMNGLDEGESWRDVGVLFGGTVIEPAQQTVTTACHHCVDPACANGCPVLAYDKDEVTGIVRHLDDQCIGCRYCELKCPYDVPKYNAGRGIVRKCDMCHGRLAEGEAPACVQSCPNEAIKIRVVDRVSVMERNEVERALVPGAFDSRYTQPTTVYANRRTNGAVMRPADDGRLEPEHGHYPLVWMLVMTQLAAGVLAGAMWGGPGVALAGLAVLVLGLGGSVLHLGRPGQGWKAFLGWRRSWLSREVIAFGAWAPVAGAFAGAMWLGLSDWVVGPLGLLTGALGVTGVWCSVMVYVDTRRPAWCIGLTAMKFFGTVGIGYFAAMGMSLGVMGMVLVKMGVEARMLTAGGDEAFGRVSALQWGPLRGVVLVRAACGLSGALLMGLGLSFYGGLALVIVGELLERVLFFRSAAAPKMPGTI